MISESNPGESNRAAPIKIQIPSMISFPGIIPYRICSCAFFHVSIPCFLAKYAPIKPVATIRNSVGQKPIIFPDNKRTIISMIGIAMINNKKYFIYIPPAPPTFWCGTLILQHQHDFIQNSVLQNLSMTVINDSTACIYSDSLSIFKDFRRIFCANYNWNT